MQLSVVGYALYIYYYSTYVVVMWELLALEMNKYKKLVLISVQYRYLFWKLSTLDGFTTSVAVAPFLV